MSLSLPKLNTARSPAHICGWGQAKVTPRLLVEHERPTSFRCACSKGEKNPRSDDSIASKSDAIEKAALSRQRQRRANRKNTLELLQNSAATGGLDAAVLPKRRGRPGKAETPASAEQSEPEQPEEAAAASQTAGWMLYSKLFSEVANERSSGSQTTSSSSNVNSSGSSRKGAGKPNAAAKAQAQQLLARAVGSRRAPLAPATEAPLSSSSSSARGRGPRLSDTSEDESQSTPATAAEARALLQQASKLQGRSLRTKKSAVAAAAAGDGPQHLMYIPDKPPDEQELQAAAAAELERRAQERRMWDYDNTIAAALTWEGSAPAARVPDVPFHFPLAIQNTWVNPRPYASPPSAQTTTPTTSSSSSSSSSVTSSRRGGGAHVQQQLQGTGAERELTREEAAAVAAVGRAMKGALGVQLPERGRRGLRGLVLASLNPVPVQERLRAWVGVCGLEYVRQVMVKEPTLLACSPETLLTTLDAINSKLGLDPKSCVVLVAKAPLLVGFSPEELQTRVQELGELVGWSYEEAAKAVKLEPALLTLAPAAISERTAVLQQLLEASPSSPPPPTAAAAAGPSRSSSRSSRRRGQVSLPTLLLKRPLLLLRSPRATAADIAGIAEGLGISNWVALRMVQASPSILAVNPQQLGKRFLQLQQITSCCPAWSCQFTQLSPSGMDRCLICPDSKLARLRELRDLGLAGVPELPKFKRVLTMPEDHWTALRAKLLTEGLEGDGRGAEAGEQQQQQQKEQQLLKHGRDGSGMAGRGSMGFPQLTGNLGGLLPNAGIGSGLMGLMGGAGQLFSSSGSSGSDDGGGFDSDD